MEIRTARTESEIGKCFPVLSQLRPHLTLENFVSQVLRQMQAHGYTLVYVLDDEEVKAAAGYRMAEFLAWGKALYIDDLITGGNDRGRGYGGALMDWILKKAEEGGCGQVHLDSGVHRHDAHRLYLNKKLDITSHHFSKTI